jgi:hypothetical protein
MDNVRGNIRGRGRPRGCRSVRGRGRANIGAQSQATQRVQRHRANLSQEQQELTRHSVAEGRFTENDEHRNNRLSDARAARVRTRQRISTENRRNEQLTNRTRMQERRSLTRSSLLRLAFEYESDIDYAANSKVMIGDMDKECEHCHAMKFKHETAGMCCSSGAVVLPALNLPPEPLKSLMSGDSPESKMFLRKIRTFNCCFQMTSFGANIIEPRDSRGRNFNSTFKVQGQVYHQIGSLLPIAEKPKFLQIYFMGDEKEQVRMRCEYNFIQVIQERAIVGTLESFLAQNNQLIQLFKRFTTQMPADNYMIRIKYNTFQASAISDQTSFRHDH